MFPIAEEILNGDNPSVKVAGASFRALERSNGHRIGYSEGEMARDGIL